MRAPVGTLALSLLLADGTQLDTIDYEISGVGFVKTGTLPVTGMGATFSATISEVPAGVGHQIRLTSRAAGDAGVACVGSATFDVMPGATTQVNVALQCDSVDSSGATTINGEFNICPSVRSTTITPTMQSVGNSIALGMTARDVDQSPSALSYRWTSMSGTLSSPSTAATSFRCMQPGAAVIRYAVDDGSCTRGSELSVTCVAPTIRINEVESNGGVPGDWVELFNPGSASVDLSGWVVKDNDDTHASVFPPSTVIEAGAYLVIEEAQLGFGLGGADSARLFGPDGSTLVDSYVWPAHAASTYGRCPDSSGSFVQTPTTKGASNACGAPDAGLDAGVGAGPDAGEGGTVPSTTVVVNEVESNGGTPGDWVELHNRGSAPADVSGWAFKDGDDSHAFVVIASGTVIPAGGYYVFEEAQIGYGLGAGDKARLYAPDQVTLIDSYEWTAHAAATYGRCPNGTGAFQQTPSTKGADNACGTSDAGLDAGVGADASVGAGDGGTVPSSLIVVNEVESNGGIPGDWVELHNRGSAPADVSGWAFKDGDDSHAFVVLAPNTVIPVNGYFVLEESQIGYGLGGADKARLYAADQTTLVDSYEWTTHAAVTYGRCPNGTGGFVQTASTKGSINNCASSGDAGVPPVDAGPSGLAWPGSSEVVTVDIANTFPSNLSGLTYQGLTPVESSVLWAVQNDPSKLYRLVYDGTNWVSAGAGWEAGKTVVYPNGSGRPDTEGLTLAPSGTATPFMYVATERDNAANGISRLAILQLDLASPSNTITALREWNLTSDLPAVGPNLGLEAITFVSDAELAEQAFREANGLPYNQARFAQNGGGIFLVGVEGTGMIHAYALNHADGTYARLVSFSTGFTGVMGLEYDPDTNYLWAWGDDTVGNRAVLFEIEPNMASMSYGQFVQRKVFERPAGLPNVNNEGVAFAPDSQCVAGARSYFWSDDSATGGHSIRRGSISCGRSY